MKIVFDYRSFIENNHNYVVYEVTPKSPLLFPEKVIREKFTKTVA